MFPVMPNILSYTVFICLPLLILTTTINFLNTKKALQQLILTAEEPYISIYYMLKLPAYYILPISSIRCLTYADATS